MEEIVKGIEQVIGYDILMDKIKAGDQLRIYWGISPSKIPTVNCLLPLIKISHFLKANCRVIILFADLHDYLNSEKPRWELLEYRTRYYELLIKKLLTLLGVDINRLFFVKGTQFQLSTRYTIDVYKLLGKIDVNTAQTAGIGVVNQTNKLSSLVYPVLQSLDEEYLDVDAELGTTDQANIFNFSQENLPKLGYRKRIHFIIPTLKEIPISLLDTEDQITKKVNKVFCKKGDISNALIEFIKYIVYPILEIKNKKFVIKEFNENDPEITLEKYEDLQQQYTEGQIHPILLKNFVTDFLKDFLKPLRSEEFNTKEILDLIKNVRF